MSSIAGRMARASLGRANRYYINQSLRDREWNRAKQPPWLLTLFALVIVGVAFLVGVYGSKPSSTAGWTIAIITILIYQFVYWLRRTPARRRLRHLHGQ